MEQKSSIPELTSQSDIFGFFFKNNPLPMWVYNSITLQILEVNQAAIEKYGYSEQEFLSMNIKQLRPEEDFEMLDNYLAQVSDKNETPFSWRHLTKSGELIWVSITSFAVTYNGKPARLVTIHNVTRVKKQEEELLKLNNELNEYKKAITVSTIVSITNRQGIIEFANQNFVAVSGYTTDELVGNTHRIVNSGYHPKSFWQHMWKTVMNGEVWRGEVCNRKKNRALYWVDSFIIPVQNSEGRVERLFSIRNDITDKKRREFDIIALNDKLVSINEELQQSRKELEKLSLVAKLTENHVLILNKDRKIAWVNEAFTRFTGYTLADAIGKKPSELLHGPRSSESVTQYIVDSINQRKPFKAEVVHYTKDGREFYLLTDGQPVFDEKGDLLQYVIVEADITEVKQKEQKLRESEIKLDAFFRSSGNVHLLVDTQLNVLAFNKVAELFAENLGITIKEGEYLPGKLPPIVKENFTQLATEAIHRNATINREFEIKNKEGIAITWMVYYLPAFDRQGNIIGCAFSATDITERKLTEDKISYQNKLLRNIAWEQSHVVRSPLANILSIIDLIENAGNEGKELLPLLKDEVNRLDRVVKDIVKKTAETRLDE